jgi:hypothetical protein
MRYLPGIVLLCLLIAGCGHKETQNFTNEQKRILEYIPKDAQFMLYTNMSEIRKTGHWDNVVNPSIGGHSESWLSDFEKQTGAGINNGISELYTCTTWDGNDIVIITFEQKKKEIEKYFNNPVKFIKTSFKGKTVFRFAGKKGPDFYFSDPSTLIILKDEDYLASVIEGHNESVLKNAEFSSLINNINLKRHYWMATNQGSFAVSLIKMMLGSRDVPGKELISSIKDISIAAEFSDNVKLESILGCKDEKSAYMISAAVRSAVAMNLFSSVDSRLGSIMENLDVERDNNKLNFKLLLNKKDILKLKELSKKRKTDKNL